MSGLHSFFWSRNIGCKTFDNLRVLVMSSVHSGASHASPAYSKVYADEQGMFWEGILSILLGEDESVVEHPLQSIQGRTHTHTDARTHTFAYMQVVFSGRTKRRVYRLSTNSFSCLRTFAMLAGGSLKANGGRIYITQWKRSSWGYWKNIFTMYCY